MGIEGSVKVLEAVAVLGESIADIVKGGLTAEDLPKLIELAKKHEVFIEAVKAAKDQVPAEVKDLSMEEGVALALKTIEVVKRIASKV